MRNTKAIFIKQLTSLIKHPVMLAQAVVFLVLVFVIMLLIGPEEEDCEACIPAYVCAECVENEIEIPIPSLAGMFTVMFVGLAMVSSSSALVQEDKITHNLRFMTMAGVKPKQYLPGTAAAILIVSFVVLILFALIGRYFGMEMLVFVAVAATGALVSILLGIAIGLSKMPILATPLSMLLGLGPMLSSFNDDLAGYLYFLYTMQLNHALSALGEDMTSNFLIIATNGLVVLVVFVWMHRKGALRW